MRNQTRAVSRLLGATVLAALLAACGSGGDSDNGSDSSTPDVIPSDVVRVEFTVFDKDTNVAVVGADINYQASDGQYSTKSDREGSGRLDLPAAELARTDSPRGTVAKDGYESQTLLFSNCPSLQGGTLCPLAVQMVKLATNVSIPVDGDLVWHLGDSIIVAGDPTNSGFQKDTDTVTLLDADPLNDRPYLDFAIPDWAAKVRAGGYTKATVSLDIKGMQTGSCPNGAIALSGDAGTATLPGANSPAAGTWARESFEFTVADIGALSANARIRVTTGKCLLLADPDDYDDFETNQIRVTYSK